MSEENKKFELDDEELEKVTGGGMAWTDAVHLPCGAQVLIESGSYPEYVGMVATVKSTDARSVGGPPYAVITLQIGNDVFTLRNENITPYTGE